MSLRMRHVRYRSARFHIYAWAVLVSVSVLARTVGVHRTRSWLERVALRLSTGRRTDRSLERARGTVLAVRRVGRASPLRAQCLEQSLTAWHLLLIQGIRSELVVGARVAGGALQAHAWLTLDGRMIVDETNDFTRLTNESGETE